MVDVVGHQDAAYPLSRCVFRLNHPLAHVNEALLVAGVEGKHETVAQPQLRSQQAKPLWPDTVPDTDVREAVMSLRSLLLVLWRRLLSRCQSLDAERTGRWISKYLATFATNQDAV